MGEVLFNFNDLSLLLVISNCLILSFILVMVNKGKILNSTLLALFLIAFGLEAFDTLTYWCLPFKDYFFADSIYIFYVLKFTPLVQGPLLFLYTKSTIYINYQFTRKDYFHLTPLLLFPIYMAVTLYNLGGIKVLEGIHNFEVLFQNVFFRGLLLLQSISIVIYGFLSYWMLGLYREKLKNEYSNLEKIDYAWLRLLIGGFLLLWAWNMATQLVHQANIAGLADALGITGNYFDFIFIIALVYHSLAHSNVVQGVQSKQQTSKTESAELYQREHVALIEEAILKDEIYLEPEITLDQLADYVKLSSRQVSIIINRHFDKNYFEFINYYRVEKAKNLLSDENSTFSMLDIMAESGFNSKSAFNRFFKKYAELTPTQYKKHVSEQGQNS